MRPLLPGNTRDDPNGDEHQGQKVIGEEVQEADQHQNSNGHEHVHAGWRQTRGDRQVPGHDRQSEDRQGQDGSYREAPLPQPGDEDGAVPRTPADSSSPQTRARGALPLARRLGEGLLAPGFTVRGSAVLLFQVHGMVETRERGAFITDLLIERGEGSLILDGDRRLPRRASPLGFAVGCDRLLQFSLGDATQGKQAYE
jgi:hypothetical protein